MKINLLLPHYGCKPAGGFKVAYIYANAFQKYGNEVTIIYPAVCRKGPRCIFGFWRTYFGRKVKSEWFPLEPEIRRIYVRTLHEKNIPDADVTIATSYETSLFLNDYSEKKGKKFYLIQDLEIWSASKKRVLQTWHFDMVKIVISQHLLKVGQEHAVENLFYIPNAIDRKQYCIYNDYENRQKIIAMMYSPAKHKGTQYGIEAILEVKKQFPEMKALMFGKVKRPDILPEWIEYYENPAQIFIVKEIYNMASIFVCSSISEGWGLPPMEAMACGAAVVTTDCGGVRDFAIPDQTAIVCPIKDSESMKAGIIKLLNDNELRIRLIQNALHKISEFDWDTSTMKFFDLIRDRKL